MTTSESLDHLIRPRPNGSEALRATSEFIATTLQLSTPDVVVQDFAATPYGSALLSRALFLVRSVAVGTLVGRRYVSSLPLALVAGVWFLWLVELMAWLGGGDAYSLSVAV